MLALQMISQLALAGDGPNRPRTVTKSNPAARTHSKASSFAPRPPSKNHAYGAPIQQPILHRRKPALKVTKPAATPPAADTSAGK
jgi:hypothetical protein